MPHSFTQTTLRHPPPSLTPRHRQHPSGSDLSMNCISWSTSIGTAHVDEAEDEEEDEDEEEVAEADWKFRGGDMGRLAVWVRGCAGAEVVWAEEGAAVAAAEGVWVPRHRAFAGLQ